MKALPKQRLKFAADWRWQALEDGLKMAPIRNRSSLFIGA
jgi:hypothetical protein